MNVAARIDRLLLEEHAQLRDVAPKVDEELGRLSIPKRLSGEFDPRPLAKAWKPFRVGLDRHLDRVRDEVLPQCLAFLTTHNWDNRDRLLALLVEVNAEHAELKRLAAAVRVETLPQEAVIIRRPVLHVLQLFDAHSRVLTHEVYPGVDTGETPIARKRTSDEMIAKMRAAKLASDAAKANEPEPPPPKAEGLVGRLRGLFGGRGG